MHIYAYIDIYHSIVWLCHSILIRVLDVIKTALGQCGITDSAENFQLLEVLISGTD